MPCLCDVVRKNCNDVADKGGNFRIGAPRELLVELDKLLAGRIYGLTRKGDINEQLAPLNVLKAMQSLKERYNKRVQITNEELWAVNHKTYQRWQRGEITAQEACCAFRKPLKEA